MKIISWNVNGLRAVHRSNALLPFIEQECPDVLLLQEIKGRSEQFASELTAHEDYDIVYHSAEQAGYAGTGIWVRQKSAFALTEVFRGMEALSLTGDSTRDAMGDAFIEDSDGRVIAARGTYGDLPIIVFGLYMPNGGKSDLAFAEKLAFYDQFLTHVDILAAGGELCFWGGDINAAHTPIDLARPKENDGNVGFHPRERDWLDKVIEAGWVDVFRMGNPDVKDIYSWWSYRAGAREKNVGWRIDCFFTKRRTFDRVKRITYLKDVVGSDHCPLRLELV